LKFFLGANEGRDFHMSNQVCEGYAQEVWHGRCQAHQDTHGMKWSS
jgi:hypothetical protein